MKIFINCIVRKVYFSFILLFLLHNPAFCKSDFKVAYEVDDQIISNYDIDQAKKLHNLLTSSNHNRSQIEKIVVNGKIKEIYANRLQIIVSKAELDAQLNSVIESINILQISFFINLILTFFIKSLKYIKYDIFF